MVVNMIGNADIFLVHMIHKIIVAPDNTKINRKKIESISKLCEKNY